MRTLQLYVFHCMNISPFIYLLYSLDRLQGCFLIRATMSTAAIKLLYMSLRLLCRHFSCFIYIHMGFPNGSDGKASAHSAGDPGLIPELGRSPGEGNGNPLQYSCLENSMDRGAWQATVHGVTHTHTHTHTLHIYIYMQELLCWIL